MKPNTQDKFEKLIERHLAEKLEASRRLRKILSHSRGQTREELAEVIGYLTETEKELWI